MYRKYNVCTCTMFVKADLAESQACMLYRYTPADFYLWSYSTFCTGSVLVEIDLHRQRQIESEAQSEECLNEREPE